MEAVDSRGHQIQNDQIVGECVRANQATHTVAGPEDIVALDLEVIAQSEREIGFIFDEKDASHAITAHRGCDNRPETDWKKERPCQESRWPFPCAPGQS